MVIWLPKDSAKAVLENKKNENRIIADNGSTLFILLCSSHDLQFHNVYLVFRYYLIVSNFYAEWASKIKYKNFEMLRSLTCGIIENYMNLEC